jgi:hypothetical protein
MKSGDEASMSPGRRSPYTRISTAIRPDTIAASLIPWNRMRPSSSSVWNHTCDWQPRILLSSVRQPSGNSGRSLARSIRYS